MKQKQIGRNAIGLTEEELEAIRNQARTDAVMSLLVIAFAIIAGAMVVAYILELLAK